MGLFKKKCEYCREKIDKGKEVFKDVKDPVFTSFQKKAFCSNNHAEAYEIDLKKPKKCTSGCCG